jgi:preprotein translocase subunit SecD
MSLFKEKRILLLAGICLLAVVLLVTPGIRYGIDIAGGSRIVLELEASQATIQLVTPIVGDNLEPAGEIIKLIEDNLLTSVRLVGLDKTGYIATFEIGQPVSSDIITSIIDNKGQVISLEDKISDKTREDVTNSLQTRVDPAGLLGVQSRPMGANLVLFEVPAMTPTEAKALLGRTGYIEAYIENTLVFSGGDLVDVEKPVLNLEKTNTYVIRLTISQEAANNFANASSGKAGYPLVLYIDRPSDAVLLFDEQMLGGLSNITYDNTKQMFHVPYTETLGYYLFDVTSVPISRDNLSESTRETLQALQIYRTRAILLGSVNNFSENVVAEIKSIFTENNVKFRERDKEKDKSDTEWIMHACGWISALRIGEGIAGKPETRPTIEITRETSGEEAYKEADTLQRVLAQRLSIRVSFVGESSIPARLGSEFAFDILKAAIAAVIAVGVLVYLRYRRPLIVGAIMLTMGSEVLVTIGIASGLRQTIGLAEIAAVLAVIGTGVEQQLIITDEVLRRGLPKAGPRPMSLSGRIGKAFAVIFAAAATTIAALATLFFVGYGAMKGFAIVMIIGILAAILVTRPAYGSIVSAIVSRETAKAEKPQVKAAQQ